MTSFVFLGRTTYRRGVLTALRWVLVCAALFVGPLRASAQTVVSCSGLSGVAPSRWANDTCNGGGLSSNVCTVVGGSELVCDLDAQCVAGMARIVTNWNNNNTHDFTAFGTCDDGSTVREWCCALNDVNNVIDEVTLFGTDSRDEALAFQSDDDSVAADLAPHRGQLLLASIVANGGDDDVHGSRFPGTLTTFIEALGGDDGDDNIFGFAGADYLDGGDGDDDMFGGGGNDFMDGGPDNDTMDGGPDNDKMYGNDGNDTMTGDSGADQMNGEDGNDSVDGQGGNDAVVGGDGADTVTGGANDDTVCDFSGCPVNGDTLLGGTGDDVLFMNSLRYCTATTLVLDGQGGTSDQCGHPGLSGFMTGQCEDPTQPTSWPAACTF